MTPDSIHDTDTLLSEYLDRIFADLIQAGRSSSSSPAWTDALGLIALRFLAADPGGPDKWASIAQFLGERSANIIRDLAYDVERSLPELDGVFTRALLVGLERVDASLLKFWTFHLSQFSRMSVDAELFGQWFSLKLSTVTMQNAELAEFATPPSVADLMVRVGTLSDGDSVYDPCCGVGTILAVAVNHARRAHISVRVFGEELSPVSWSLCTLRLFFLGQNTTSVILGDSLRRPRFTEGDHLQQFDRTFCQAPIGATLRDVVALASDERFKFSAPGRGFSDSAFVQHAAASTKPDGMSVLLVSNGFLSRAGADARVREGLLHAGLVRTVIALPEKLLANTAIPTALLVLGQSPEIGVKVIDASDIQPKARGKAELSSERVEEIVLLARGGQSDRVRIVSPEEVRKADFNLLPRRYIHREIETELVDTVSLRKELQQLESAARRTAEDMDALLDRLEREPDPEPKPAFGQQSPRRAYRLNDD